MRRTRTPRAPSCSSSCAAQAKRSSNAPACATSRRRERSGEVARIGTAGKRVPRLLLWALFLSLLFHFTAGPLLVWLFGTRTPPQPKERIFYAASSALRIARRPKPVPPRRAHPQPKTAPVQPHPAPQPVTAPVRQRHELARIDRRATVAIASPAPPRPPAVHPVTMQDSLQRDEARFQKTIARLREENNPVISAARPVPRPEAPRRVTYDFAGSMGSEPQAEGILTPEQRWRDGPYNYYRVRYWVQYADGTTETGRVPWPIRYLPDDDPFARHYEHFPLPGPLPDFTLPAGFSLHPLVAFCYSHRFALCPIAHA